MTTSGMSQFSSRSTASSARSVSAGISMNSGSAARGAVMASRIHDAPIDLKNKFTIRLTPDNYLYWRTQVDPILRSNLPFGFVDGTLSCPA